MSTDLSVDGVTHSYRNPKTGQITEAIGGVSLTARAGTFTSIIGPSGCGKSTLLRIMAGLVRPSGGSAFRGAEPVSAPTPDIGFVFQEASLYPWRDVISNVAFGLELQGVKRKERLDTARHYVELVGLQGWERAYPRELSGGMQQRAAIARALAMSPPVLLLDEPFGALDEQTRLVLGSELLRIWESTAATVVLVTHSIQEAVLLSDSIVLMTGRPGRIQGSYHVPIGRPRDDRTIGTPDFQKLHAELWENLRVEAFAAAHRDEERSPSSPSTVSAGSP